jgi:hydrogenase small subunit
MEVTRRNFLKYAAGSAALLALNGLHLFNFKEVMAAISGPPVIWLSGAGCTGCSVSFLNAVNPTADSVLLNSINLKYHSTLIAAAGALAVQSARSTAQAGGHILVVEGAIPTGAAGRYCYVWEENGRPITMAEAVTSLAANAKYIVAAGTCSAFGGIPAVNPVIGVKNLGTHLGKPVVNLPGCPVHPDWLVGTLVTLLSGATLRLDSFRRPTAYYGGDQMCDECPREEGPKATRFAMDGRCLKELGCKGPKTHADCWRRLWNNRQNYCISANGLCIGCTEPNFPAFPLHQPV